MKRDFKEQLLSAGLSQAESAKKAEMFQKAAAVLKEIRGGRGGKMRAWYVPGRIEFLGKHTDYAGGRSMLCTLERGICLVAFPRDDHLVRMADAGSGVRTKFIIAADIEPHMGRWSNYPMTVARRLSRNFPGKLRGADIVSISDLPPAAGMSSSSALIIAVFAALAGVNDLATCEQYKVNIGSQEDLAAYLASIENGQSFGSLRGDQGVGTFGGSEDHTAILCCRPGSLSLYSFCPVRRGLSVPVPDGLTFVVGVSGVAASKAGAAREDYNRASALSAVILQEWRHATARTDDTLASALDSSPEALKRMRMVLGRSNHEKFPPQVLLNRLEQFNLESNEINLNS